MLRKTWQETAAAAGVVTMVREDVREGETPLSKLNLAEKSLKKKTLTMVEKKNYSRKLL